MRSLDGTKTNWTLANRCKGWRRHDRHDRLAALARRLLSQLASLLRPAFHSLNLIDWSDIVIGGHDIRDGSLLDEARRMWTVSRAISPGVLESVTPDLIDIETRLRPGTVWHLVAPFRL